MKRQLTTQELSLITAALDCFACALHDQCVPPLAMERATANGRDFIDEPSLIDAFGEELRMASYVLIVD